MCTSAQDCVNPKRSQQSRASSNRACLRMSCRPSVRLFLVQIFCVLRLSVSVSILVSVCVCSSRLPVRYSFVNVGSLSRRRRNVSSKGSSSILECSRIQEFRSVNLGSLSRSRETEFLSDARCNLTLATGELLVEPSAPKGSCQQASSKCSMTEARRVECEFG